MFEKLAELLKNARTSKGITLQQLAAKSRIDLKFLQNMEDGNFTFLPDLYVKAFIKEYCRFVGLDEIEVVKKYTSLKDGKGFNESEKISRKRKEPLPEAVNSDSNKEAEKENLHTGDNENERKRKPVVLEPTTTSFDSTKNIDFTAKNELNRRNLIIMISAAGLLILLLGGYLLFKGSENEIVTEKPIEQIIEENAKNRYVDNTDKKETTNTAATKSDSLLLILKSEDSTWVTGRIDDTDTLKVLLIPDKDRRIAAAKKFDIKFGNNRSVTLELNGKALELVKGKKGKSVMIDADGIHYKETPKQNVKDSVKKKDSKKKKRT